jgi:putative DNA primase/helicase
MRNIDFIREVTATAAGHWPEILYALGAELPRTSGMHGPCPACGGKDRFRFDDNDRGSHICNQCGAGDGLELVSKMQNCDATTAARAVAEVLSVPLPERQIIEAPVAEAPRSAVDKVERLQAKATLGQSAYLASKGLRYPFPILADGALLVTLTNGNGDVTGAQVIKPDGSKRLVAGTVKKGSFCVVNSVESTETVIIAEGLATALTLHLLCPEAVAVVAVDAGNLLPVARVFRDKYPQSRMIIAGDNDWHAPGEVDEHGKPKINIGRIAAEKTSAAVKGETALPPGEKKADWDDYRQEHGEAAARDAFYSSLCTPVVEPAASISSGDLRPFVDGRRGGLWWVEPKLDKDTGEVIEKETWLSTFVEVVGVGEDDAERYLILSWTPEGSTEKRTEAVPLCDIGEREGWARMKKGGVLVTSKSGLKSILADHLQRSGKRDLWAIAGATGWQYGAYIMPDGSVIGEPHKPVMFNGRSAAAKGYEIKGTVASWKNSVAALARGNPSMMLGIACSFAAPLIGLAGADGFGVHLFGGSSAGKTTTANAASSIWGCPDALKLTWYSTALGLVNEAAAHNDGFMPLDEIGQGSNRRAVAEAAYALFNGVGKIQGAKEGGNRDLKRWRAMAFSTGEIDLESYIRADGGKINAGQLVRLLNVPITRATVFHGLKDGKAHADAMKDAYQNHYGAAGQSWVTWLCGHNRQATESVREAERRWAGLLPAQASEQVRRVGSRFAILEAALLLSSEMTGWNETEIRDALTHSFNAWVNEFGLGNREAKAWTEQAEAFLQRHGFSRYLPYPDSDPRDLPIKDLAGYRVTNQLNDTVLFHTWPSVFRDEIAAGANYVAFAQVLADAGMLDKPKKGITKKTLMHNGKQCHFVVLSMVVDEDEEGETQ